MAGSRSRSAESSNGERKLIRKGREQVLFEFFLNRVEPVSFGDIHMHTQNAIVFTARDRQRLMRQDAVGTRLELIIRLVDSLLIRGVFDFLHAYPGKLQRLGTDRGADLGTVADLFRHNIPCALQCLGDIGHLIVEESLRRISPGVPFNGCWTINSASGSNPFSRATIARVRRFFL